MRIWVQTEEQVGPADDREEGQGGLDDRFLVGEQAQDLGGQNTVASRTIAAAVRPKRSAITDHSLCALAVLMPPVLRASTIGRPKGPRPAYAGYSCTWC
jgi:hypothetical protein